MIDTHCHFDLFGDPMKLLKECELLGIIVIGMTNLPSHFEMGYEHVKHFKTIRLALGMHPLYAVRHSEEFEIFQRNLARTSYIGEIGLDFSNEGISTREIQLVSFHKILHLVRRQKKILSLHSRKAEEHVLQLLIDYGICSAIFHWYSGPVALIQEIVEAGYFFSINTAMIRSKSGQEVIRNIPKERVLTESDGPFININGRPAKPTDMQMIQAYLSAIWNMPLEAVGMQIDSNFKLLVNIIR